MSLSLAPLFTSGMVLQRDLPASVWGTASPHSRVVMRIQGQSCSCEADGSGSWHCTLASLRASDCETLEVAAADEHLVLSDVAVGEVFVAGGQSNMEFWMRYDKEAEKYRPTCDNPRIRFYDQPKCSQPGQTDDVDYSKIGLWRKATPQDLDYFSAVGYYFARGLEMVLDVPVGIVGCNYGDTTSAAWMTPEHARVVQPELTAAFDAKVTPGALFTYMVRPIAGFATRGVLWYQGESDDDPNGAQWRHEEALRTVIADWRSAWERPDLPFLVVQLPGLGEWMGLTPHDLPTIRACQQRVADKDDHVWLCSASDMGDKHDIHPKEKKPIGERLALLAMRHLLGMPIPADAPRCTGAERKGSFVILRFEHAEGGMVVAGAEVNALEVLCDGKPTPFRAAARGDELVVMITGALPDHIEARFAQTNWYRTNLYNGAEIPALPFAVTCA